MSSTVKRVKTLEISEDVPFQERMWTVQRIGWVVMALFILAALLGLLGRGFVSSQTAGQPGDPLWIEYDRFAHLRANHSLAFHIGPEAGTTEEVSLWIDRQYLENLEIERITPEPDSVSVGSNRLVFTFKRAVANEALDVTIDLRPKHYGRIEGRAGLNDTVTQTFSQFVYP